MSDATPDPLGAALRVLVREVARELAELVKTAPIASPAEHAEPLEGGEQYLSVQETCERFQISRATFDRTLRDPSSGLAEVIVRFPPATGRAKVPLRAFEAWLRERRQRRRTRRGGTT